MWYIYLVNFHIKIERHEPLEFFFVVNTMCAVCCWVEIQGGVPTPQHVKQTGAICRMPVSCHHKEKRNLQQQSARLHLQLTKCTVEIINHNLSQQHRSHKTSAIIIPHLSPGHNYIYCHLLKNNNASYYPPRCRCGIEQYVRGVILYFNLLYFSSSSCCH